MMKGLIIIGPSRLLAVVLVSLTLLESRGEVLVQSNWQVGESKQQPAHKEVKQLITILRDEQLRENEPERVVQAIQRLGEMRSVEAIDTLIQLLTFKRSLGRETGIPSKVHVEITLEGPESHYPAIDALFQIGKPALPALIKVIEAEESDSAASENAQYTVMNIFRGERTQWVEYLIEAAAKATSPEGTQRLQQAADQAAQMVEWLKRVERGERVPPPVFRQKP